MDILKTFKGVVDMELPVMSGTFILVISHHCVIPSDILMYVQSSNFVVWQHLSV